jgi:hypothetical protein
MAIVQALLAALFRSAGKLLNMAFGWATIMLFGKVPQDRQLYLSVIAFGSVIWLVALVAIVFPGFGAFLLAFVTLPPWVNRAWIRMAMAVAAIVIPAIVGWISTRLVDPAERPRGGRATLVAIGRGYPYTVGLAVTLIMLTVFAPVLKVRNMARRWSAQHVPVIIKPEDYLEVLDDLQRALERGGLRTRRKRAGWMLRLPTKILTIFSRRSFSNFIADRLTRLVNKKLEVLVHPADLVISGRETDAARARAILSEHLTLTKAYLTWDKEANDVEDRLRAIWDALEANRLGGVADRLDEIERHLRTLTLPYEEWEVLFRQTLMAERALLQKPASAFLKSPKLGRRLVATLVAAAPLVKQAADTVREVRGLAAPLHQRSNHTLADHVADQLNRFLARAPGGHRLRRFLRRAA